MIEMGEETKHAGYVTDIITDQCLNWLKLRSSDKPFVLMCHHKAPHRSWFPDEKHARMYENVDILEPETFNDDYATRCEAARHQRMTVAQHLTEYDLKGPPPEDLEGEALKKWKYQRYCRFQLMGFAFAPVAHKGLSRMRLRVGLIAGIEVLHRLTGRRIVPSGEPRWTTCEHGGSRRGNGDGCDR